MMAMRLRLAVFVLAGCLAATAAIAGPIDIAPGGFGDERLKQAITLLEQGDLKRADAILQEVLQKDPSQVYALLGRVQVAMSERRLADAQRGITAALSKSPELPAAHAMKGVVLLLQKRPDEAQLAFRHAIELQPRYAMPHFYLGVIARAKGDYSGAAAAYKALTLEAPNMAAGYLGQAEAQMMLRNAPEAFRILQAWKSVPGAGVTPFQVIANLHLVRKEPAEAVRELQDALAKSPGDSVTLTFLGDAYAASGDQRKALDTYRSAVIADSHNAVAANNLAWVLSEQPKGLDEALKFAQTATRLDPNYADAVDTLGWVQFQRGNYADAVATLTKAGKLAPTRTDIAAHLGQAYLKAGSKTRALAELKRALAGSAPLANRAELERIVAGITAPAK
jgi:tetratricopeptide (TPR) repeat protein